MGHKYKSARVSGSEYRKLFGQFVQECINELPPDKGFHVSREAIIACVKRKIAQYKSQLGAGTIRGAV